MPDGLNPRLNAFRSDLADIRLQGRVDATRFVAGEPRRIVTPIAPLRRLPDEGAALDTELLIGERVLLFDETADGWSWVQADADSYVGYVPAACIGQDEGPTPTNRVVVPRTLVFPAPDIKRPPLGALPMGALVAMTGSASDHNADYAQLGSGGFVVKQHLASLGALQTDFVAIAEQFLGVPYLWGGKSALGIDCSGVLQLALQMTGVSAPRDSGVQERDLGTRLAGIEALKRGDLVFWKGHVGMMLDGQRLFHANAHHMMTAIEPLQTTVERLVAKVVSVSSVRRLPRV